MELKRPLNLNKDLFENYTDSAYTKLNEKGYSRIWEHCSNGFFVISACDGYDHENLTSSLRKDLKSFDFSFIEQKGYYNSDIAEISFLVPFNSSDDKIDLKAFQVAVTLMKKYQKEAVIIYDKYSDDSGSYFLYNDWRLEYAGEFHRMEELGKYMAALRSKLTSGNFNYHPVGIRAMRGHGSLSPYYAFVREGYIPIQNDFSKLQRRYFPLKTSVRKDRYNN